MKKILVPTDFSKTAEAAINYAIHLFNQEEAELHLLHAYRIPISDPMTPMGMVEHFVTQQQHIAEKHFEKYANDFVNSHPAAKGKSIKIITHIEYGMGAELIKAVETKIKPNLIVMGTNGSTAHRFKIGSVAARTAINVKTPIIMIPPDTAYRPIEKIVFATNYNEEEAEILQDLMKNYNPTATKIYCVHIVNELDVTEQLRLVAFEQKFSKELEDGLIQLDVETTEDVVEGINTYVENKQANLLVMLHSNKNFFQKIFSPSVTSSVVFKANTPVMVYHQNKK